MEAEAHQAVAEVVPEGASAAVAVAVAASVVAEVSSPILTYSKKGFTPSNTKLVPTAPFALS